MASSKGQASGDFGQVGHHGGARSRQSGSRVRGRKHGPRPLGHQVNNPAAGTRGLKGLRGLIGRADDLRRDRDALVEQLGGHVIGVRSAGADQLHRHPVRLPVQVEPEVEQGARRRRHQLLGGQAVEHRGGRAAG